MQHFWKFWRTWLRPFFCAVVLSLLWAGFICAFFYLSQQVQGSWQTVAGEAEQAAPVAFSLDRPVSGGGLWAQQKIQKAIFLVEQYQYFIPAPWRLGLKLLGVVAQYSG